MGIRAWLSDLQRRRDEAAVEREEEWETETPAERAYTAGGVEGLAADERTARLAGEASMKDVDRLGD